MGDAVQLKATENVHLGQDEKEVPYRKQEPSSSSISPSSSISSSSRRISKGSSRSIEQYGKAQLQKEKHFMVDFLDYFDANELKEVNFSLWLENGVHKVTVNHMLA